MAVTNTHISGPQSTFYSEWWSLGQNQLKTPDLCHEMGPAYNTWREEESDLNGNEDDNHPLQSQTVLLTQVVPHQVSKLCTVLQLLIHNLKKSGPVRKVLGRSSQI